MSQASYPAGDYWVQNFKKTDGLPEDIIIDITQDHKGYIWMTTPHKLVRYDGYSFKIFNPNDQFPDAYVHFYPGLEEDVDGILWMFNLRNGLFSFNPVTEKFTPYTSQDNSNSLSDNNILSITKDKAQTIWISTFNGLNRINKIKGQVLIEQFGKIDVEPISKFIDTLLTQNTSIVNLTKIGNDTLRSTSFEISDSTYVLITCLGESVRTVADYGYILNMKGDTAWKYMADKIISGGGASKNALQLDIVKLPPGKYSAFYKSDDSHAWNNWNDKPPIRPDWWGIQVTPLKPDIANKIEQRLSEVNSTRGHTDYSIQTILHDSNGTMWAISNFGLDKITISSTSSGGYLIQNVILPPNFYPSRHILELDGERLIIAGNIMNPGDSASSLCTVIYNHKANTFEINTDGIKTIATSNSKCFVRDKNHNYWLGSFENNQGLYVSSTGSDMPSFKKLDLTPPKNKTLESTGNEQIWTLFEDRSGYIWVGSRQNGLYKIKSQKSYIQNIIVKDHDSSTSGISYDQIAEDGNGTIWLLSTNNVITGYNRKTKQIQNFPYKSIESSITILVKENDGNILLSDGHHTRKYDQAKAKFLDVPLHVPDSLRLATMDANGNYWAVNTSASSFATLFAVYNGKYFQFIPFDSTSNSAGIRNIHLGRNGHIWLAPSFTGVQLYTLNNQTKTATFNKRYLPEGVDVFDIYEDEKGIVWIGTYDNGLVRLDPMKNTYTSFTIKDGLPSNFIQKIIAFDNMFLIITDLGAAFLTLDNQSIRKSKELDEYLTEYTNGEYPNSTYDQGLINKILKTTTGEIALVTKNGFCLFDPDDFGIDTIKPLLQISTLTINGHSFHLDKLRDSTGLSFPHFQNDIEIEYIGLQYDRPDQNQYAYILKGSNKEWILAGTDRIARYANLPPGHYEFFMRASNADGVWSDDQMMFSLTINPPWWRTWWAYSLYGISLIVLIWRLHHYQKLRTLRIERERTQQRELAQAKEIEKAYTELETAHENLKATQKQLIQSEKMASLGELTAGIAHEIQNPLNFVNNFSDLNQELLLEMKTEIGKGNIDEATSIANDVMANEEKINHHGKRADAIVKGMLQHSRSNTGIKEPTDINALADEYLRLAYHGLRAKNKSFNATMKTDFDPAIGMVNVIPQDIGRVILNLITNAFYAVSEKQKSLQTPYPLEGGVDFEPLVSVSTKLQVPLSGGRGSVGAMVTISVRDNGSGIPQSVLDKIFQPFFTTKPTGQGTGLGLSLSYDIVKAHGGDLLVETKEGEGSTFIIQLPVGNP
ncbi:MAG: hypothetical protein KBA14_02795 [Saprospiraceae bacterium]|nr:hypothetical protein [Saprospiraceae bacterium]